MNVRGLIEAESAKSYLVRKYSLFRELKAAGYSNEGHRAYYAKAKDGGYLRITVNFPSLDFDAPNLFVGITVGGLYGGKSTGAWVSRDQLLPFLAELEQAELAPASVKHTVQQLASKLPKASD